MSGYILCQVKKATQPFYLECINRNIYTYEELCYFLTHNLYLLDERILNDKFCNWIAEELELGKLGRRIKMLLQEQAGLDEILIPIVKEHNYLTMEEYRTLTVQLTKYEGQPVVMKGKLKADSLIYHGKYADAILLYQQTLSDPKSVNLGGSFVGSIYHNLGCAYIRLFQQEEAMDCFYKAYEYLHSHEALKSYLIAFYMCRDEEQYETRIKELRIDPGMKALLHQEIEKAKEIQKDQGYDQLYQRAKLKKEQEGKQEYEKSIDGLLIKLTREYHRNTGL